MATLQRGLKRRAFDRLQHGSTRRAAYARNAMTASSTALVAVPSASQTQLPVILFASSPSSLPPVTSAPSKTSSVTLPILIPAASPFYDPNPPPQHPGLKNGKNKSEDRQIALGRTIRKLQPLLPTLLQEPLPSEILSPSISLHLFPTTHPHLPAVRGRVAYSAALWTAPVAWGQIPFLGRLGVPGLTGKDAGVRLVVESERMFTPCPGHERLVIRWRTADEEEARQKMTTGEAGAAISRSSSHGGPTSEAVQADEGEPKEPFRGIFIFEFDDQGRIGKHTIETVDTDDSRRGAARFISLAEWLMRLAKGKRDSSGTPDGLAPGM